MSDRGNVVVQEKPGKRVYLYTHWDGSQIGPLVARVLAQKRRWDDPAYLARLIFCALVAGQEFGETGFGISTGICDNDHPILVVDVKKQEVYFETDKGDRIPGEHTFAGWAARATA